MTVPKEEKFRTKAFQRNEQLEKLLHKLNALLGCSEEMALDYYSKENEDFPIVFVMGPLRSGTTLFMQWLANTGIVAYPTNLMSRFYGAPVMGALFQLLLTDDRFNFRNEILDFTMPISFNSENGKTKGALAPNEFWYFWRRFLPFKELDWLSDEELLHVVDKERLVAELTTLTRVFGKPFALKSMILNYNIPFLNEIFHKSLFVQLKRDPVTNVASILDARKRQLGNENEWYSFKIPEYPQLRDLDPVTQSAGQLHFINKAVTQAMSMVDQSKKIVVQYETFCQNPRQFFEELADKLRINKKCYIGPDRFNISRNVNSNCLIETALARFVGK